MEDNSKLIAYTIWIDRIKNASNEEFFPLLREFFNLLVSENQKKAETLEKEGDFKYRKLNNLAEKALNELRGLLEEIEEQAKKEKVVSLPEIEEWSQITFLSPTPSTQVEALEMALWHTLEGLKNSGKFRNFKNNLFGYRKEVNPRTGEEFRHWYIRDSKFYEAYPAFKEYKEYLSQLIKEDKKEILPYAAYDIIKRWSDESHRRDMGLVDLGEQTRSRIIRALNILVLYFLEKDNMIEASLREPEWREDFYFSSNTLGLPPYGKCEFQKKTFGKTPKINRRALLLELVFNRKRDGIDALLIRKSFRERDLREPSNREIDAMMIQINKRFKKYFKGADVLLENIGFRGRKVVRLSVYPSK